MFRYRVLLIDTERTYERPVQGHFNQLGQAERWAVATLKTASDKAYVQFYQVRETEIGWIKKSDIHDQGPAPQVQPVAQEAG